MPTYRVALNRGEAPPLSAPSRHTFPSALSWAEDLVRQDLSQTGGLDTAWGNAAILAVRAMKRPEPRRVTTVFYRDRTVLITRVV